MMMTSYFYKHYRYINVTIGGEFKHLPDPYACVQDLRKVCIRSFSAMYTNGCITVTERTSATYKINERIIV